MITDNKNLAVDFISKLPANVKIKVEEVKETRSMAQNRLYWAYLSDLNNYLKDTGMMMTAEALHTSFSTIFIEWKNSICPLTNEIITERKSTTKLNKKEFNKYIDDIRNYLISVYNINVPLRTEMMTLINNQ